MKIHNLEIRNIRGIPYYQHNFQGKNAIILGPNGTGKSSLLDAIDFLLNGEISRLQGEGTSGVSLREHGVHLNESEKPKVGYVRATLSLAGQDELLLVERNVRDTDTLVYLNGQNEVLDETVRLARQGQHMLTRRQMLNFITVRPANRAEKIQALLNLEHIEIIRQNLVSVLNKLKQQRNSAKVNVEGSRSSITSILGLDRYIQMEVIRAVNDCRRILGASSLEHVSSQNVTEQVRLPVPEVELAFSPTLLAEHASNLLQDTSESNIRNLADTERNLRGKLREVRNDNT